MNTQNELYILNTQTKLQHRFGFVENDQGDNMTTKNAPRIFAYLRASTIEQDATRARNALISFAAEKGLTINNEFVEKQSGASLKRPELFNLLNLANHGDILLTEQVDRLSRLNAADWLTLKNTITQKGIRVVALDLPTSHMFMAPGDDFTARMFDAVNAMMLDMLAAIARKDYEDRRRRAAEGIAKAKAAGVYRGRPANKQLHADIIRLAKDHRQNEIARMLKCAPSTVSLILQQEREKQSNNEK